MLKRQQMETALMKWRPNWSRETIRSWSQKQLTAIYQKERKGLVDQIRVDLGLN